jgi:hypothetical protein
MRRQRSDEKVEGVAAAKSLAVRCGMRRPAEAEIARKVVASEPRSRSCAERRNNESEWFCGRERICEVCRDRKAVYSEILWEKKNCCQTVVKFVDIRDDG